MKLSPELTRFIESMGMYFESFGIPRIGGRILGLLLVAHEPLSAESIASILKVSRASISTNFRLLLASSMAEKVTFPGDRTTYFVFPETAWEKIMNTEVSAITAMKTLAQQGLDALPPEDSSRRRIQAMIDWSEFLIGLYQNGLIEWRARQQQRPTVS
jgi:DNA-binding transcriptional regulator GbsR (MarR family)